MDLTTSYLGLSLRSPLVPSASPLSEKIENVRAMEQAGAAAVVFHSLFEEQIEATAPEFRVDPNTYLENIAQAKRAVGIPIIGSLNCTTLGGWISYARRIAEAGADALELNIYKIPTRAEVTGSTIENIYVETVRSVRAATKIPLAVKLSPYFSSFATMAVSLDDLNVDGLVLFNRFYQPDIDIEKMEVTPNFTLSTPADMRLPLHWIGNPLRETPGQSRSYERYLSGTRRDQARDGRRRRDHVMQRADASWHPAHSADRNGPGRMAGATPAQIPGRNQRHHESAELS